MKMRFSVVIAAFNRVEFLPGTLATVWAQRFTDYETIVVDDGSTDGTREYLATLGDRVRVVCQSNAGAGAARNAGIAVARGDYVAFLDSDDIWFPWTLATFAEIIAASAPSILTASVFDFHDIAAVGGIRETAPRHRLFDDFFSSADHAISVGSGTAVIKRDVLQASGGFTTQPINGEDHDLILRLGEAPGFAQVLQPFTLGWRRHPGSVTAQVDRSVAGMAYLVAQERAGQYPGGAARTHQRRRIITRHVRPVTFQCLRQGRRAAGWRLYRATMSWNAGAGHWAYLAAFPVVTAWSAARSNA